MKTEKTSTPISQLTPEAQARLVAYTTAAGLGAFFVAQPSEAVVLNSGCLGPYPNTFVRGDGTGYYFTYHYMDVDGNGTNDFNFNVDNFRINIGTLSTNNFILSPASGYYALPWTNGAAISASTGTNNFGPTGNPYGNWLATDRYSKTLGNFYYVYNGYSNEMAMGFSFVDSSNLTHFGYIDLTITNLTGSAVGKSDFSATITGVYWETEPNKAIVVGAPPITNIVITGITVTPAKAVTISFISPFDLSPTNYVLQTSTGLGAAANWTTDTNATFTGESAAMMQATTVAAGGPQQYFRIKVIGIIQ
jgi:hypothetical protein